MRASSYPQPPPSPVLLTYTSYTFTSHRAWLSCFSPFPSHPPNFASCAAPCCHLQLLHAVAAAAAALVGFPCFVHTNIAGSVRSSAGGDCVSSWEVALCLLEVWGVRNYKEKSLGDSFPASKGSFSRGSAFVLAPNCGKIRQGCT